ncbi:MAG TPA: zinc-dependent peptidase, partial [Chitinophagaceae bacterium]
PCKARKDRERQPHFSGNAATHIFGIIRMSGLVDKIVSRLFKTNSRQPHPLDPDEESIRQSVVGYMELIGRYIPYFQLLSDAEKLRFVARTWHFRQSKSFHFLNMEEQADIPILLSAAAVQITFGLTRYKLPFFKKIYVMPDAYLYQEKAPPYIGHVSSKGIFISWKHFLQGYADSTDNVNVAIHEMAHALSYDNFVDVTGVDWEFRQDFAKFPTLFGPAIADLIVNKRCYLRPYAYTNLQEFWAVSVEAFFENPIGLKDNMPRLYAVIVEILNQDLQARHRINTAI